MALLHVQLNGKAKRKKLQKFLAMPYSPYPSRPRFRKSRRVLRTIRKSASHHPDIYAHKPNPSLAGRCARLAKELEAGGKPSTWFPPGKLVELIIWNTLTRKPRCRKQDD